VRAAFETIEAMYAAHGPAHDLLHAKRSGMASSLDDQVWSLFTHAGFAEMRCRDLGEAASTPHGKGIAWVEWTISASGRRLSAANVFIDPVRSRTRLIGPHPRSPLTKFMHVAGAIAAQLSPPHSR
jgi:hypothetical protein